MLLRPEILIAKVPQRHNNQLEIAMYFSNSYSYSYSFGIFLFFSELLRSKISSYLIETKKFAFGTGYLIDNLGGNFFFF